MVANLTFFIVDTEDAHPTPTGWTLREFGAVEFETRQAFYGRDSSRDTFRRFQAWLTLMARGDRPIFISDNPAYDWPPIHFYMMLYFGENPFGHSARRIGDFYAGLVGDFRRASEWKALRQTTHDHHPVHDAMGNAEALAAMMAGERA